MTRSRGTQVRPTFVSLLSLILFLLFLRTNFSSHFLQTNPTNSQFSETLEEQNGDRILQSSTGGRHVLGLQQHQHVPGFAIELRPTNTTTSSTPESSVRKPPRKITRPCENVREHEGFPSACAYVQANTECHSGTVIEYITVFYCKFANAPILAYFLLCVWLLILFYMLGNTAADYFCCSLEKLSDLLRLPPTVAGVSLLPLGNGAPDVFASIASFLGPGHIQVGLNSVLGGAVFVTSVVAGSVCLAVQPASPDDRPVKLDFKCFLRDVGFFWFSLAALSLIIYSGKIHFFGAVGYLSIYILYGITVAAYELIKKRSRKKRRRQPILTNSASNGGLQSDAEEPGVSSDTTDEFPVTPWEVQAHHIAIYSHTSMAAALEELMAETEHAGGYTSPNIEHEEPTCGMTMWEILDLPLGLPRRLTIPIVEEDRWSWKFAIASATLAPTLLAGVWDSSDGEPFGSSPGVYAFGIIVGIILGGLAYYSLEEDHPPTRWSLPWVVGGFVMSIVWFYLIANELVAVLVALGVIFEIDSAILGLTVLAWGNSIGDLISNLAFARGGDDEEQKAANIQIAISGCFAGPMFNTLVGLGLSFVLASWKRFPKPLILPEDDTLIYTIGFLFLSLLWSLIVLPARKMAPSKVLGVGLLFLYASFMSLRLANSLGLISLEGFHFDSSLSSGYLGVRIL